MPLRRLPSLTALRAFEAAARLNFFKDAATEIGVTPGTIRLQIRGLEDVLGVALFHRDGRVVSLTEASETLFPDLSDGIQRMRRAVDSVANPGIETLKINANAAVINKFLLHRLNRIGSMQFEPWGADYVVDMAISGNGVMLGWSSMCQAALAAGQLVCPFGPALETDIGVYLVCRHDMKSEHRIRAFADWIQKEAALITTLYALHTAN